MKRPQDLTYQLKRTSDSADSILLRTREDVQRFEDQLKLLFAARGIFETSQPAFLIEYRTNARVLATRERQIEILVTISEEANESPSWYMILLSPQWAISGENLGELANTIANYLPLSNTKWLDREQRVGWS